MVVVGREGLPLTIRARGWWARIPSVTQIASGRVMVVVGREGLPLAIRARGWWWVRIPSVTQITSGRVVVGRQNLPHAFRARGVVLEGVQVSVIRRRLEYIPLLGMGGHCTHPHPHHCSPSSSCPSRCDGCRGCSRRGCG